MTAAIRSSALQLAFADPVFDSQAVFRKLMLATSYPGRIVSIEHPISPPTRLNVATTAICLSLTDLETPLWLDRVANSDEARNYLRFHCGVPIVDHPHAARFAVVAGGPEELSFSQLHAGEVEYPDRSATLIFQVPSFVAGPRISLSGPGIKTTCSANIAGLPRGFWSEWDLNREIYPLGIDVFFTCDRDILALPRTVKVEV